MRLSPSDLSMTKLGSIDPEKFEIFSIEDLTDTDWGKPILKFIENPTG